MMIILHAKLQLLVIHSGHGLIFNAQMSETIVGKWTDFCKPFLK